MSHPDPRLIRAEDLLGRRVVDANGRLLGRLREMEVERDGLGGAIVVAFHIGRPGWVVSWRQMDLSDPAHPRLRITRESLRASSTP